MSQLWILVCIVKSIPLTTHSTHILPARKVKSNSSNLKHIKINNKREIKVERQVKSKAKSKKTNI